MKKRNINEIFGLKKERSNINIYKKEDVDFDKLIKDMGILKYLDEKILKKVRVDKVEKNSRNNEKNIKRQKAKINLLGQRIYQKLLNRKKIFLKNSFKYSSNKSYDSLKNKTKISKKNKHLEEKETMVNNYRSKYVKNLQEKIKIYDEEFKNINSKMNSFFESKRKEFEQIIEDEFPTNAELNI